MPLCDHCVTPQNQGVKDVVRDVLLPWYNAYRFLVQSVLRLEAEGQGEGDAGRFVGSQGRHVPSPNLMDQWIQVLRGEGLRFRV